MLLLLLLAPPLLALLGNLSLVIAPCLAPEKRANLGDRLESMARTSTMPAAAQANPAATSAVLPSCRVLLGLENTSSSITTIPVLDTLASERSGSGASGDSGFFFFGVSGQKLLSPPLAQPSQESDSLKSGPLQAEAGPIRWFAFVPAVPSRPTNIIS